MRCVACNQPVRESPPFPDRRRTVSLADLKGAVSRMATHINTMQLELGNMTAALKRHEKALDEESDA